MAISEIPTTKEISQIPGKEDIDFPERLTKEQKALIAKSIAVERLKEMGVLPGKRVPFGELPIVKTGVGLLETAGTLASGAVTTIAGGIAGAAEGAADFIMGGEDPIETAVSRIEKFQSGESRIPGLGFLPFEPKTVEGKAATQFISMAADSFFEFVDLISDEVFMRSMTTPLPRGVSEETRRRTSAAGATIFRTGLEFAPGLLGIRHPWEGRSRAQANADIAAIDEAAKKTGIDLERRPSVQRLQVESAALKEAGIPTPGPAIFATREGNIGEVVKSLDDLQLSVQKAKASAELEVNRLYQDARRTDASVEIDNLRPFQPFIVRQLEDFDIDEMPVVQKRLAEIEEIMQLPGDPNSTLRLNTLEKWRKRLVANMGRAKDLPEAKALGILKASYDKYLDALFDTDMIRGNPEALTKWKKARSANAAYRKRYRDDRFIKKLVEQQMSPEEVKQWLIGASATGAKKQAGDTVKSLKKILGEDSLEIAALRDAVLLDILEPLLRTQPAVNAFARNWAKISKNNPTLVDELLPHNVTAIRELVDLASGVEASTLVKLPFTWEKAMSRALFGHAIAKAWIKISLGERAFQILKQVTRQTRRRRIMGQILGYDPFAPMINKSIPIIAGTLQSAKEVREQEDLSPFGEAAP